MKKYILLFLAFVLIILPINTTYAASSVEVTLIEPHVDKIEIADEIVYRINVKFNESLYRHRNFFLTLKLDDGLSYVSSNIAGFSTKTDSFKSYPNTNEFGEQKTMTVRLTDMELLAGKTSFDVEVKVLVTDKAKVGEKLKNILVFNYQQNGDVIDAFYDQFSQTSNYPVLAKGTVAKNSNKDEILKVNTGDYYGKFMPDFEGLVTKGNIIKVQIGEKIQDVKPNADGSFVAKIPYDYEGDVIVNSFGSDGKFKKTLTLTYIAEEEMEDPIIENISTSLRDFGFEDLVNRILQDFKAGTDRLSLTLGFEGGTRQQKYELFEKLYFATRRKIENSLRHEAFMKGYPEGNFLPGNPIKRSEVSTILSKIIAGGEVTDMKTTFPDVPTYEWYTKYTGHLQSIGIMKGYEEDGTFRPNNFISRAEFASIVARYMKLSNTSSVNFSDIKSDHWALTDINKIVTAGIMQGYPEGNFGPENKVTRAEAATIINRMLGRFPDETFIKENKINGFTDIKTHWAYYQIVEATYGHDYVLMNGREQYK